MSDDEELLYGLLGTQFNTDADEKTEFKRSKLKRKAADEEVVDAKGYATRFHGAFTGGFSAGYFNTVGSKEGFQPSEFVSQARAKDRNYRITKPEDFMDEDDFGENGIAPRLLRTKSIFDNEDIRSHMKQSLGSHEVVGDCDILKDILVPQSMTIGLILLRKLGYLASRGVGEKSNFPSAELEDDDDEAHSMKKFNYEAEETFQLIPKSDRFGLGYSGMKQDLICAKNVPNEDRGVTFGLKNKKGIRGVAFGGVDEEDEDANDLKDIYGHDSMSKYNYEYVEDEKETNFGWTAPKHSKNAIMPSNSIAGFQLCITTKKASLIHYEPAKPPRFYLPIYPIRREKENMASKKKPERAKLMPNEDPGSVFNLLSSGDRERLLNMGHDNQTKKGGSRWGNATAVVRKEENHDITENLISIRNETKRNSLPPPPPPFFEEPLKKEARKSWALGSSLSSKFKSAGSSTSNQDLDYQLGTVVKVNNDLELSTKELAAKSETYGFMTRTILEWHPDKLLCKRFNVPDPYPGDKFVGIPDEIEFPTVNERKQNRYSPTQSPEPAQLSVKAAEPTTEPKVEPELKMESNIDTLSTVEIKTTVPDLSNKPSIDLFKAVFDDSDANFSSSEEDEPEPVKVVPEKPLEMAPVSFLSTMEQALGAMFGGNSNKVQEPKPLQKIPEQKLVPKENIRIFGPTPPPDFVYTPVIADSCLRSINDIISRNLPKISEVNDAEPYEYLEKEKTKKRKHEKKSKKSKKAKTEKKDKKEKHKKKTKKKKHSTDGSSDD